MSKESQKVLLWEVINRYDMEIMKRMRGKNNNKGNSKNF